MEEKKDDYMHVTAESVILLVTGHNIHLQASSDNKGKNKMSRSPAKLPRQFGVSSVSVTTRKRAVVENLSFVSALASQPPRGKSRRTARDRRTAPGLLHYICFKLLYLIFHSISQRKKLAETTLLRPVYNKSREEFCISSRVFEVNRTE